MDNGEADDDIYYARFFVVILSERSPPYTVSKNGIFLPPDIESQKEIESTKDLIEEWKEV